MFPDIPDYSDVYLVDFHPVSINYDEEELINKLKQIQDEYPDKQFVEVTFSQDLSGGGTLISMVST